MYLGELGKARRAQQKALQVYLVPQTKSRSNFLGYKGRCVCVMAHAQVIGSDHMDCTIRHLRFGTYVSMELKNILK